MSKPPRRWSPKEDKILLQEVSQLSGRGKAKDWTAIAEALPGRSNKDCRKRWCNQLVGGLKKGPWDPDEDSRLRIGVDEYGDQWTLVAEEVGTRSADQCAKRWHHSLNPSLDQSKWSAAEDATLLEAVQKHGRAWRQIQIEYFPDRASNNVKNRYVTLTRKRGSQSSESALPQRSQSHQDDSSTDPDDEPVDHSQANNNVAIVQDDQFSYDDLVMDGVEGNPYWQSAFSHTQYNDPDSTFACQNMIPFSSDLLTNEFMDSYDPSSDAMLTDAQPGSYTDDAEHLANMAGLGNSYGHSGSDFDDTFPLPTPSPSIASLAEGKGTAFALTISDPSPEIITGVMNFLAHSRTKFRMEIQ